MLVIVSLNIVPLILDDRCFPVMHGKCGKIFFVELTVNCSCIVIYYWSLMFYWKCWHLTQGSFTYSDCDCKNDVAKIAITVCEWALKMAAPWWCSFGISSPITCRYLYMLWQSQTDGKRYFESYLNNLHWNILSDWPSIVSIDW